VPKLQAGDPGENWLQLVHASLLLSTDVFKGRGVSFYASTKVFTIDERNAVFIRKLTGPWGILRGAADNKRSAERGVELRFVEGTCTEYLAHGALELMLRPHPVRVELGLGASH